MRPRSQMLVATFSLAIVVAVLLAALAGCSNGPMQRAERLPNGVLVYFHGDEAVEVVVLPELVDVSTSTSIILRSGEVVPCRFLTVSVERDGVRCIPPESFATTRAGD